MTNNIYKDRVKENCTFNGTGDVTLIGATSGSQAFINGLFEYTLENSTGAVWEVGIGTVTASVLTRQTVYDNSSGNTSLIDFGVGNGVAFAPITANKMSQPFITDEAIVGVHNASGQVIPKGAMIALTGGITNNLPEIGLAQGNTFFSLLTALLITKEQIANGADGVAVRFGEVSDLDTSAFSVGDFVWLSPDTPGGLTNTPPEFPDYRAGVGQVTLSGISTGSIFVDISTSGLDKTFRNFYNGSFREPFNFLVTSDNVLTITGTLTAKSGDDGLTMFFSDGFSQLVTNPPIEVTLTAGTVTSPQRNYVYVLKSTKTVTVSTSGWPIAEHIKIAEVAVLTVGDTFTDGALINHNHNDPLEHYPTGQGHLSHITERIRLENAKWSTGAEGMIDIQSAASPDDVYLSTTAGVVYQLHSQIVPALDMETGDPVIIVNDSVTPYLRATNLNVIQDDASGNDLTGEEFSLVLWGVANSSGEGGHLMLNLPTDSYTNSAAAIDDANNYSVYSIPEEFVGTGFLIARFTVGLSGNGSVWTLHATEDLRGSLPNTSAGGGKGGTGVTTWLALTDTPNSYIGEALKLSRVNIGETAIETVTADKTLVGLPNVDNTSDLSKPISTATQTALDDKVESVVAGTNITVDNTDPLNPIVSAGAAAARTFIAAQPIIGDTGVVLTPDGEVVQSQAGGHSIVEGVLNTILPAGTSNDIDFAFNADQTELVIIYEDGDVKVVACEFFQSSNSGEYFLSAGTPVTLDVASSTKCSIAYCEPEDSYVVMYSSISAACYVQGLTVVDKVITAATRVILDTADGFNDSPSITSLGKHRKVALIFKLTTSDYRTQGYLFNVSGNVVSLDTQFYNGSGNTASDDRWPRVRYNPVLDNLFATWQDESISVYKTYNIETGAEISTNTSTSAEEMSEVQEGNIVFSERLNAFFMVGLKNNATVSLRIMNADDLTFRDETILAAAVSSTQTFITEENEDGWVVIGYYNSSKTTFETVPVKVLLVESNAQDTTILDPSNFGHPAANQGTILTGLYRNVYSKTFNSTIGFIQDSDGTMETQFRKWLPPKTSHDRIIGFVKTGVSAGASATVQTLGGEVDLSSASYPEGVPLYYQIAGTIDTDKPSLTGVAVLAGTVSSPNTLESISPSQAAEENGQPNLDNYITKSNGFMENLTEKVTQVNGTVIDVGKTNVFSVTRSTGTTFTFEGWSDDGADSVTLELTTSAVGLVFTFTGVTFKEAPTIADNGLNTFVFTSVNGGAVINGYTARDGS